MDKFVLHVPEWKGELVFSEELLIFLGVILMLIVGTLFCFWGYKYFRTILFLGIGAVVCYLSYLLVEPMTTNLAVRMFLTVSLTFLGVCLVYFLDIIFCYVLDKLRIRNALGKRSYLLAAPLGAVILGLTIYFFIWRDEITVGAFSVACLIIGLIFQHFKRKKQVRFRSYNDLIRMKRPNMEEDGLEILSAGMAGTSTLASVASVLAVPEPEHIAEPEADLIMPVVEEESEMLLETEPEPEFIAEPEPEFESEPEFEPEPVFVMNARLQALAEIESEFAAGSEYEHSQRSGGEQEESIVEAIAAPVAAPEPEPIVEEDVVPAAAPEPEPEPIVEEDVVLAAVPEPEPIVEETVTPVAELEKIVERIITSAAEPEPIVEEDAVSVAEPEPIVEEDAALVAEPEPAGVPLEISDEIKELLLRKMESDEELLEEAFFVKQISKQMAQKRNEEKKRTEEKSRAASVEMEGEDIRIEKISPVYPGRITIAGKDRKSRRKREEGMTKAAAIAAAGLGAFIVGRISKGGD